MARGGKREGAGRKPGTRTEQANHLTRQLAIRTLGEKVSPLDLYMDDIRFWKSEIKKLEQQILPLIPKDTSILLVKSDAVDRYLDARKSMLLVADKAAPFIHPRITPVAPIDPNAPGYTPAGLKHLTDDELNEAERISRKIAAAYGNIGREGEAGG